MKRITFTSLITQRLPESQSRSFLPMSLRKANFSSRLKRVRAESRKTRLVVMESMWASPRTHIALNLSRIPMCLRITQVSLAFS